MVNLIGVQARAGFDLEAAGLYAVGTFISTLHFYVFESLRPGCAVKLAWKNVV